MGAAGGGRVHAAPIVAAPVVAAPLAAPIAPVVAAGYAGPLNLNTHLVAHPNGAVVPLDEPAVAAARADHFAAGGGHARVTTPTPLDLSLWVESMPLPAPWLMEPDTAMALLPTPTVLLSPLMSPLSRPPGLTTSLPREEFTK